MILIHVLHLLLKALPKAVLTDSGNSSPGNVGRYDFCVGMNTRERERVRERWKSAKVNSSHTIHSVYGPLVLLDYIVV